MEKYYSHINSNTPGLTDRLANFIVEVNEFLLNLTRDERYSSSRTKGKSACSNVTFEDGPWGFKGERHRGNVPLVDYAVISFRNQEVWKITRTSRTIRLKDTKNIQHCLQGAAKNYRTELPWCGPEEFRDDKTGLIYRANYFGKDEGVFYINEVVYDPQGVPVWHANCRGGYV